MLNTDKKLYEKMVAIWSITKMPMLNGEIVSGEVRFSWAKGPIVNLTMELFEKLEPLEIVQHLEKKMDEQYGINGKRFRSDFSGYFTHPFSSQRTN
jgi:hypothetical protein|tara:strand:+ start:236 stop:523 length:288 start_codon:yes stop_codon:yes gene_type:complete